VATAAPEQALEWEARQGPRAAICAALGALLVIGSGVGTAMIFNDAPVTGFLDSLARAGGGSSVGGEQSLRIAYYEFYEDRAFSVLLTAVARGLGFVCIALMLAYVGAAVRSRTEAFKGYWLYVALAGGGLGAVATIMFTLGTSTEISAFLDGPRTVDTAEDIGDSSLLVTAQLIGIPGTQAIGLASLALGLAWVVISLNAMRVGLLTRFMGVLGIICGALIVLPLLSPLPIVQTFWLGAMAVLLAGRWPNGVPPAWQTGEAHAWPTGAELRAQRQKAMAERRAARGGPEPEPEREPAPAPAGGARTNGPHAASSKKKKRKRRT
jgi:hypothetical protein